MQRRQFLKTAAAAPLAGLSCNLAAAAPNVAALFEASSPAVLALAGRVMEQCVLAKIMPPTPPLEHTWVVPGGPYYQGQWIWDTMFVVDLLSILPGKNQSSATSSRTTGISRIAGTRRCRSMPAT